MFAAATYIDRRCNLQRQFSSGLLLFLGNEDSPMNYADNPYPFRQDSTWLYYFGVDQPGFAAVIDIDNDRTTIFADDLTMDDIVWTGILPAVADLAARAGVTTTAPSAALPAILQKAGAQGRKIRFLPPYRSEHRLKLQQWLSLSPDEQSLHASLEFLRAVIAMRMIKSDEEIAEIERAVDVTIDMHLAAMRMARPGMQEAGIAAKVTEIALAAGGGLSFPVIATIHGETLHNHDHSHTIEAGQLFLLDAGAETARHYAGDLTSTFPVATTFGARQKEIYEIVLAAHLKAIAALRPGVPFREIHRLASLTLAEGLKGLGLMRGNLDDAVHEGAHALFFQCGVGHMLGLDVHDMENLGEVWVGYNGEPKSTQFGLKSLRLARPLEPGFVFTIEPGLYFIPELIRRWRGEGRFREFVDYERVLTYLDFGGVRIEENLLVTQTGYRILGKQRPRTIAEVEAVRAAA
ncbi:MAG: aminopeptidase P family protein [Vicinamibacteria bacterium]|jgi:Xaa-Pro aminopeptidase|nr:aminopeptidase P family protein [Vicinamibacteria bacterium]